VPKNRNRKRKQPTKIYNGMLKKITVSKFIRHILLK